MAVFLVSLLLSAQVIAETRYITNIIHVPMRAGPGNEYKILHRGLRTGTSMKVLQADAGNGFSKVLAGEQEGFVRSQYLVTQAPALVLLPALQKNADKTLGLNDQLREELSGQQSLLDEQGKDLAAAEELISQQKIELRRLQDIASDPQAIDRRNKQLVLENQTLKNQSQLLETENNQLMKDSSYRWYLYGGGTIFLGILLGLFLPMLKLRKKQSDWT